MEQLGATPSAKRDDHLPSTPDPQVLSSSQHDLVINERVALLEGKYKLGLSTRDKTWSPSRRRSDPDSHLCYERIKWLYFKDRVALSKQLETFDSSANTMDTSDKKMASLLQLLGKAVLEVRQREQGQAQRNQHALPEDPHRLSRSYVEPQDELVTAPADRSPQPSSSNSKKGFPATLAATRQPNSHLSGHGSGIALKFATSTSSECESNYKTTCATLSTPSSPSDGDTEDYCTPPQSPTLNIQSIQRLEPRNEPVVDSQEVIIQRPFATRKRCSEDSAAHRTPSPKHRRTYHSGISLENSSAESSSCLFSRTSSSNLPQYNSFPSTTQPSDKSFARSNSKLSGFRGWRSSETSFTSTADTTPDEGPYRKILQKSSPTNSWDDEIVAEVDLLEKLHARGKEEPLSNAIGDLHLNIIPPNPVSKCPEPGNTRSPAHYSVRDLPDHGLFVQELPEHFLDTPIRILWECTRLALACNVPPEDLIPRDRNHFDDYEELWNHFRKHPALAEKKLPPRTPLDVWQAAQGEFQNLTLKANLCINPKSSKTMFSLRLYPFVKGFSCRFQRAFGGDRLLYLDVPNLKSKLPAHLANQQENIQDRYQEWLSKEKKFLGRTWRVLHAETIKKTKGQRKPSELVLQRLILFATSGWDILPKEGARFERMSGYSKAPETTVGNLINWFMPLEKNFEKKFCKAYARLELGFSKTLPALEFRPSEIRYVRNKLADTIPESTDFNDPDPSLEWENPFRPDTVMNDGCSQISAGAAKEMWFRYSRTGTVPSVFQGRIGGAKGVWILSAPIDVADSNHQARWIEINDSQKKFAPHDEDSHEEAYDKNRLTFELVTYSKSPSSSALYLSFLPILLDRGVPRQTLRSIMGDHLDYEKKRLLTFVKDPVALRKWIEQQQPITDSIPDGEVSWLAGLPLRLTDKAISLLESGFTCTTSPFLADVVLRLVARNMVKFRTSLGVPIGRSTQLLGIADPYGVLKPGEVHLSFSRDFCDEKSGEGYPFLDNRDIIVTRHPTLRRSDIQKVRATYKLELRHIQDVVVFASTGCFPLAAKLQGGDYDGDRFWVCWEPDLVRPFRNAPASIETPTPEDYGITVDRRKLGEVTSGPECINQFLQESFKFKCNPDLLGVSTIFHRNLSYHENSIASPGVNALADLHDLLVDSSKNGYVFDDAAYHDFIERCPWIQCKKPKPPAYKKAIEADIRDKNKAKAWVNRKTPTYNENHIVDYLYFHVIVPHTKATYQELKEFFKENTVTALDAVLAEPFLREKRLCKSGSTDADPEIEKELKRLEQSLTSIYQNWRTALRTKSYRYEFEAEDEKDDPEIYNTVLEESCRRYSELLPSNKSHSVIRRWTRPICAGALSDWEILKASALFVNFHSTRTNEGDLPNQAFCFHIGGRELARIKARATAGGRQLEIIPSMRAALKSRKLKLPAESGGDDNIELESDDDDDRAATASQYEDAVSGP